MPEDDAFGDLVRINHMLSSSELNLVHEGLLLGMRNGALKVDPLRSPTSRLGPSPITQHHVPSFVLQEGTTPLNGKAPT
jgi:hypothetical protein